MSRLERESKTIEWMTQLYCRGNHHTDLGLCSNCEDLLDYAKQRLSQCPFQDAKPTCVKCPVHCYKPEMRNAMRRVMRYAGPRMIFHHPILTILHYIDGWREDRSITHAHKSH